MSRRRHFIIRSIVHEPWEALLDGLAFLGFFRANVSTLKDRYDFGNARLRGEYHRIRQHFPDSYSAALPIAADIESAGIAAVDTTQKSREPDEMEDYWIFFHELAGCVAARTPRTAGRTFIFSTVYHALVHGMYNAVIHGDPGADIGLRVDVGGAAVTLGMSNRVVRNNDEKQHRQPCHTRFGIRVGGAGKGIDTLTQLFDHAELRIDEQRNRQRTASACLSLRHDLMPRPWLVRLKRAFLGRAIATRDHRQLYHMAKAYSRTRQKDVTGVALRLDHADKST